MSVCSEKDKEKIIEVQEMSISPEKDKGKIIEVQEMTVSSKKEEMKNRDQESKHFCPRRCRSRASPRSGRSVFILACITRPGHGATSAFALADASARTTIKVAMGRVRVLVANMLEYICIGPSTLGSTPLPPSAYPLRCLHQTRLEELHAPRSGPVGEGLSTRPSCLRSRRAAS